jgi:hypothetical protein
MFFWQTALGKWPITLTTLIFALVILYLRIPRWILAVPFVCLPFEVLRAYLSFQHMKSLYPGVIGQSVENYFSVHAVEFLSVPFGCLVCYLVWLWRAKLEAQGGS